MNGDEIGLLLAVPWLSVLLAHVVSACRWQYTVRVYRLRLPRGATVEHINGWMAQLAAVVRTPRWWDLWPRWPIGIELVATGQGIERLVVFPARFHAAVVATLAAALPGARLYPPPSHRVWRYRWWVKAGEMRLRGVHRLLAIDRSQVASRHLLAALQPLHSGELVRIQWLLVGARRPRTTVPAGPDILTDTTGQHSSDTVAPVGGLRWHQADPVLGAVCRIGVATYSRCRARALLRQVRAALRGLDVPYGRLVGRWLPTRVVAARITYRTIPLVMWPITATTRELSPLLGMAVGPMALPGVALGVAPTLPPSPSMPSEGVVLARANHPSVDRLLCLARQDRLRHMWVAGPTGAGKSTLLANLISYDIHRGDPVIVIDAGGDLVTDVLARIPDSRHQDVIVVDPTSTDHLIGLNPLHSHGSQDNELAANLVMHVLESMYASSWGPRTADILRASLLTLTMTCAPDQQQFTLCDLIDLLTNTGFRRFVTSQSLTPALDDFWSWYESLPDTQRLHSINPALNKLRAFSLYTPLRLTLGQSEGIDFTQALQQHRIVLVPLRTGILGAETAALIGSLVMAAVWQATLARAGLPQEQRHPVWMYLDEFQQVVRLPIDLADMLAQARGFGLGLTLAHQYLDQLSSQVKAAVLGTTRTQLIFQLQDNDATELAPRYTPLTREDLANLGPYEIALRPCVGGTTLAPVTGTTYPLPPAVTDPHQLTRSSLHRYGLPARQIEDRIAARSLITPTLDRRSNRMITGAAS